MVISEYQMRFYLDIWTYWLSIFVGFWDLELACTHLFAWFLSRFNVPCFEISHEIPTFVFVLKLVFEFLFLFFLNWFYIRAHWGYGKWDLYELIWFPSAVLCSGYIPLFLGPICIMHQIFHFRLMKKGIMRCVIMLVWSLCFPVPRWVNFQEEKGIKMGLIMNEGGVVCDGARGFRPKSLHVDTDEIYRAITMRKCKEIPKKLKGMNQRWGVGDVKPIGCHTSRPSNPYTMYPTHHFSLIIPSPPFLSLLCLLYPCPMLTTCMLSYSFYHHFVCSYPSLYSLSDLNSHT